MPEAPEPIYALVGLRIAAARNAIGMTQGDLAARVGMTRTSIVNAEKGRQRIPLHALGSVADALGVPLAALVPSTSITALDEIAALRAEVAGKRLERAGVLVNAGAGKGRRLREADLDELVTTLLRSWEHKEAAE